jgi:hypothetical protein
MKKKNGDGIEPSDHDLLAPIIRRQSIHDDVVLFYDRPRPSNQPVEGDGT